MWYCQNKAELPIPATRWTKKKSLTFKINWISLHSDGFTRNYVAVIANYGEIESIFFCRHPSQTAFLSSVDLHTQAGYQIMMPEVKKQKFLSKVLFKFQNFSRQSRLFAPRNTKNKGSSPSHQADSILSQNAPSPGFIRIPAINSWKLFTLNSTRDCELTLLTCVNDRSLKNQSWKRRKMLKVL